MEDKEKRKESSHLGKGLSVVIILLALVILNYNKETLPASTSSPANSQKERLNQPTIRQEAKSQSPQDHD